MSRCKEVFALLLAAALLTACGAGGTTGDYETIPLPETEESASSHSPSPSPPLSETCAHEHWENGRCTVCGVVCEHPSHDFETQLCSVCGEKVWHSFAHGACSCGAFPDIRTEFLDPHEYYGEQEEQGSVVQVPYQAENYVYPDGPEVFDKQLLVYLPYGYDENEQYDVLFLIHGTGGHPEDFFTGEMDYYGPHPKVRGINLFDYIFANKIAKPMILVAINTRAVIMGSVKTETSTEQIGQELRNDIFPCVIEHFSTYAQDSNPESIAAVREHFGLCGISTGSIFAFDSGILQNFDLFGSYIVLSGDGQTEEALEAISSDAWAALPIDYLYSGAGTVDIRGLSALHTYQHMLHHSDKLIEGDNAMHVIVNGGHKWCVWFTSLYNAMQLIFPNA